MDATTTAARAPRALPLSRTALLLIALLFAGAWFAQLNYRHLIPSDEGRYAEMAREMFVTGDWITPRYNGDKYFEKPPLQIWFNALTFAWFGVGEWQARLYTALTGFGGILLAGYTGARVFNATAGVMAAVVLASSPYWNLIGHYNLLDNGLSFWMELTLCALLLAQLPDASIASRRGWMWVCWAALGFAVLSKGLVWLIVPSVLLVYSLVARDWALWKRLHPISGALIFAVVAVPWIALVQGANPEFFHYFFVVQQLERYLTPAQHRPGPIYYFVPVLLIGFLPWLSICWQSVRHALRMPRQTNGFAPATMLLVWSAFIFVFFSISHSKLIPYMLPIAPALAMVIGAYLPRVSTAQWRRHLLGYLVLLIVAAFGALFLAHMGDAKNPNALYRQFQFWIYAALAACFALTLVALWLNRLALRAPASRALAASIAAFAFGWFAFCAIGGNGHEVFGRYSSGALLAPAIKAELAKLPPDTPFYSVNVLDHTLPFYAGHTMIMVQHGDELSFGARVEPNKWVPTVDEWVVLWKRERYAMALLPLALYEKFAAEGLPMQVVARDLRRVVVAKSQP
ncbi:glycosyltransferase family 39 protein [Paraburkholderia sp.]|uniref:glycosyltransferase family 39 protein n=1 Tax=Paraburkholderia sp. TaxID=1926495 RepID=UPI003D6E27FD